MIPTTMMQRMGAQPVAARRLVTERVCGAGNHRTRTTRLAHVAPAYLAARTSNPFNATLVVSGFWGGVTVTTSAIKRPARHLGQRTT